MWTPTYTKSAKPWAQGSWLFRVLWTCRTGSPHTLNPCNAWRTSCDGHSALHWARRSTPEWCIEDKMQQKGLLASFDGFDFGCMGGCPRGAHEVENIHLWAFIMLGIPRILEDHDTGHCAGIQDCSRLRNRMIRCSFLKTPERLNESPCIRLGP